VVRVLGRDAGRNHALAVESKLGEERASKVVLVRDDAEVVVGVEDRLGERQARHGLDQEVVVRVREAAADRAAVLVSTDCLHEVHVHAATYVMVE